MKRILADVTAFGRQYLRSRVGTFFALAFPVILILLFGAMETLRRFRARKDPATCYRTVKRITGLRWLEIRRRGSAWVVQQFMAQCQGRQSRLPQRSQR